MLHGPLVLIHIPNREWPLFRGNKIKDFSKTFKQPHDLFCKPYPPQFSARWQLLWHEFSKIMFIQTSVLYKSFTYLLTILHIVLQWLHRFPHNQDYWPFWNSSTSKGPLILNSKTFKHHILFQWLSRALKMATKIQALSRKSSHPANNTSLHFQCAVFQIKILTVIFRG